MAMVNNESKYLLNFYIKKDCINQQENILG